MTHASAIVKKFVEDSRLVHSFAFLGASVSQDIAEKIDPMANA